MKILFCFLAICLAGVFGLGYSNWGYSGYGAGWPVGGYAHGYSALPLVRSAGWVDPGYAGWTGYSAPGYGYSGWAGWKKH